MMKRKSRRKTRMVGEDGYVLHVISEDAVTHVKRVFEYGCSVYREPFVLPMY